MCFLTVFSSSGREDFSRDCNCDLANNCANSNAQLNGRIKTRDRLNIQNNELNSFRQSLRHFCCRWEFFFLRMKLPKFAAEGFFFHLLPTCICVDQREVQPFILCMLLEVSQNRRQVAHHFFFAALKQELLVFAQGNFRRRLLKTTKKNRLFRRSRWLDAGKSLLVIKQFLTVLTTFPILESKQLY